MANIDVYDANLHPLGTMERVEAHREGQWHRSFHCWLYTREGGGALLFQRRSHAMTNFPGLLDVSAAGHLDAGESVADGIREIHEEIGIPVAYNSLKGLGERVEVADQPNGQKNREYQSVFLYEIQRDLGDIRPSEEEVAGLFWLPLGDGMRLFSDEISEVHMRGFTYEKQPGEWKSDDLTATSALFLPRIQRYYLTVLIMAERLIEGKTIVAIS